MNMWSLLRKCPILRRIQELILWVRGGSERSEYWQGNRRLLRLITYGHRAEDEEKWFRTGRHWVESWILPAIEEYIDSSWTVLEIGCGPGRLLEPLASRFKCVVGVDFSPDMVRYARHRLQRYQNVRVLLNDGRTIPLPASSVDFVYSVITFQHMGLEAIQSYFQEVYRVLRPGGIFRFQTRRDLERRNTRLCDRHFLSKEEAEALATRYGFHVLSYEAGLGHPTWHWFTLRKPHST